MISAAPLSGRCGVPARRAITLRHLLTNTSGYGMAFVESPLQRAMAENGTEAGPEPVAVGADEWLARLADLPLAFQPGEGWRYHHSFALLGILLARLAGRPLGDHLAEDIFGPLEMTDTALWVPEDKLHRLPAAYRHGDDGLVEIEPVAGGFYAGPRRSTRVTASWSPPRLTSIASRACWSTVDEPVACR